MHEFWYISQNLVPAVYVNEPSPRESGLMIRWDGIAPRY